MRSQQCLSTLVQSELYAMLPVKFIQCRDGISVDPLRSYALIDSQVKQICQSDQCKE